MKPGVDPARTRAVVVAVEEYDDPAWNVTGPYGDACAFISWLVDRCGVPEDNVTLVSSPLAGSRRWGQEGVPRPPWERVQQMRADSGQVNALLQEGLMHYEADLLWVFWSGHGLIDPQGRHVLLLSDATRTTKRAVAVDGLQRVLQSERVGRANGRGVKKVAVAINACQNQPPGVKGVTTADVLLSPAYVAGRGLFVLHASSVGQRALVARGAPHRRGAAASLFSRALVTYLDDGTGSVLPDLQLVSDRLDAEFARLRACGETSQIPSLLRQNWEGRTAATGVFAAPLTAREQYLADVLDPVLRRGGADIHRVLARGLTGRTPVAIPLGADAPTTEGLVAAAARAPHGIPTLRAVVPGLAGVGLTAQESAELGSACRDLRPDEFLTGDEHAALIRLLAREAVPDLRPLASYDRSLHAHVPAGDADAERLVREFEAAGVADGPHAWPLLFRFLAVAAAECQAAPPTSEGRHTAADLRKWCERTAARLGISAHTVAARWKKAAVDAELRRRETVWMLFRVDPEDPEAEPCRTSYACHAWLVDPATGPQRLDYPPGHHSWQDTQRHVAALLAPWADDRAQTLGAAFFLPHSQLELPVERIPLHHAGDAPLGNLMPVVVRSAHQGARRMSADAWMARWGVCAEDVRSGPHHWLVHEADRLDALQKALAEHPERSCVELVGPAVEFAPALMCCVQAGVPVMTWHRRHDGHRQDRDLNWLRSFTHPHRLPYELKRLRDGSAVPGWPAIEHLVLLWDDPERQLPRFTPRSPGRTPHT